MLNRAAVQAVDEEEGYEDGTESESGLTTDEILQSNNVAKLLDAEDLSRIGRRVCEDFEMDAAARGEWETRQAKALKLALQVMETKSFPWPNAANVKFPLITVGALQYHSRAYPELINGTDVVQCRVIGPDADGQKAERAMRIAAHMSFQVLEEDPSWEEETDRALIAQAIVGCTFKKTFFDPKQQIVVSEHVLAKDLYVPYFTKDLKSAERVTHYMQLSRQLCEERERMGLFCELEGSETSQMEAPRQLDEVMRQSQGITPQLEDMSKPYDVLEQHRCLDLDDDGLEEPYIVWVRKDTRQVLRILPRFFESGVHYLDDKTGKTRKAGKDRIAYIDAEQFFTKYPFVPSPDGGFYDCGFGQLLGPINESIDTTINQLLDAGTMATTGGGFLGRGVKVRGGNYAFAPWEWKRLDSSGEDIAKNIYPLPIKEPSPVLFQLLQLLISYGERIGMATDQMVGESPGQNTPAETSRNTMEQGMAVFNGIYKRTHRALRDEFRKIYRLNQLHLPDSKYFIDMSSGANAMISRTDYDGDPVAVRPAADPNVASDSKRFRMATALKQEAMSGPGFDMYQVNRRVLKAMRIDAIDQILPDPKGPDAIQSPPPIQIEVAKMKVQAAEQQGKLNFQLAMTKLAQQAELQRAKLLELETQAALNMAQAKGVDAGHAIARLDAEVGAAKARHKGLLDSMEILHAIMGPDKSGIL